MLRVFMVPGVDRLSRGSRSCALVVACQHDDCIGARVARVPFSLARAPVARRRLRWICRLFDLVATGVVGLERRPGDRVRDRIRV